MRMKSLVFILSAMIVAAPSTCLAATPVVVSRSFSIAPFSWSFDASVPARTPIFAQVLPVQSFASIFASDPSIAGDQGRFTGTGSISLVLDYYENVVSRVERLAGGQVASVGRAVGARLDYNNGSNDLGSANFLTQATCRAGPACVGETRSGVFDDPGAVQLMSRPLALSGLDIDSITVALLAQTIQPGRVTFDQTTRLSGRLQYTFDTLDVAAPVPEPATWLMLLAGTGMIGAALRRSRGAGRPVQRAGCKPFIRIANVHLSVAKPCFINEVRVLVGEHQTLHTLKLDCNA